MTDSSNQISGYLFHTDGCANPLNHNQHKGSNLRKISEKILEKFSQISENSRICIECRILSSKDDMNYEPNTSFSEEPVCKKRFLSREDQLELLLTGLKDKFCFLPTNHPLRLSILTIAPECWSARQIASEFGTSERQAKKAKILKKSE